MNKKLQKKRQSSKMQKSASQILSKNEIRNLITTDIIISFEPIENEWSRQIPDEVNQQIPELHQLSQVNPKEAIDRLQTLKEKYPNVPILYNYLGMSYSKINPEKAKEIAYENYKNNPRYLFAKLNYAENCLRDENIDRIPEIFEEKYDLKLLYPNRDTFHYSEAAGFFGVLGFYWAKKGMWEQVNIAYDILQNIDPDNEYATRLESALYFQEMTSKLYNW